MADNFVYDVRRYTYENGVLEILDVTPGFDTLDDATRHVLTVPGIEDAEQQELHTEEVPASWAIDVPNDDGTETTQQFVSIIRQAVED